MKARRPKIQRWIQAALALYLAGVVLVAAVHQHSDRSHSHDCALCVAAHMPKAMPADPAAVAPPSTPTGTLLVAEPQKFEFRSVRGYLSRAPPQA